MLLQANFQSGHVGTVYDWVGSLSLTPEYFTLSMAGSMDLNPALPIETVGQATLSMHECNESPPFPDETVCFHGFGSELHASTHIHIWICHTHIWIRQYGKMLYMWASMKFLPRFGAPTDIPSEDNMWEPVSEKPPLVLLEGDEVV